MEGHTLSWYNVHPDTAIVEARCSCGEMLSQRYERAPGDDGYRYAEQLIVVHRQMRGTTQRQRPDAYKFTDYSLSWDVQRADNAEREALQRHDQIRSLSAVWGDTVREATEVAAAYGRLEASLGGNNR